jgi:hypothetical protein
MQLAAAAPRGTTHAPGSSSSLARPASSPVREADRLEGRDVADDEAVALRVPVDVLARRRVIEHVPELSRQRGRREGRAQG